MIHPTAILEGDGIDIDPTAEIGACCYIRGPVIIGPRSRVSPFVTIGTDGEHKARASVGAIRIGADVVLREHVAVQRGTGERETTIGDGCYVMHGAHVAHDVVLAERVTLSPYVVLGGHTRVHEGATIGIGAMTHQHSTIGAGAMVGMGAVVTRDVPPFACVVGNPARYLRINLPGLRALGLAEDEAMIYEGQIATTGRAMRHTARFVDDSRRPVLRLFG